MKSFYSIVMAVLNPAAQERVAVGLLVYHNMEYNVRFSEKKLRFLSKFLDKNRSFLMNLTNLIESKVKELNSHSTPLYFDQEIDVSQSFEGNYFDYLSIYNNNLIQFSKPKTIKEGSVNFDKLFTLLISRENKDFQKASIIDNEIHTLQTNVYEKLIKKVENKVHTNYTISSKNIPNLYFNFEIDCIGLNGSFISAKSLPLDQSTSTLHHKTSDYMALANLLEDSYNRTSTTNQFFLISDEPTEIKSERHRFWEKLNNLPKIKLVNSEQSDSIAELIDQNSYRKFLD